MSVFPSQGPVAPAPHPNPHPNPNPPLRPAETLAAILSRIVRVDAQRLGITLDEAELAGRAVTLESALRSIAPAQAGPDQLRSIASTLEAVQCQATTPGATLPITIGRSLRGRGLACPDWLQEPAAPQAPPPATPIPAAAPSPAPPAAQPEARSSGPGVRFEVNDRVRYRPDPVDATIKTLPTAVIARVVGPDPTRPGRYRLMDGQGKTWNAPADRCEAIPEPATIDRRHVYEMPEETPAAGATGVVLFEESFAGGVRFALLAEEVPPDGDFPAPVAYVGLLIDDKTNPPRPVVRFGSQSVPYGTFVAGLENTRYTVEVAPNVEVPSPPRVLSAVALEPDAWAPNPGDPWP